MIVNWEQIGGLGPGGLGFESGALNITIPIIRGSQEFQITGPQTNN